MLSQLPNWARASGAQPIPGYRLIEPIGRGGYGEVWKCEAPGGLFKAVKFVLNRDEQSNAATQEQQALNRVKAIRHPFILSLERVEVVENVLIIVMELADKSLSSLLGDYQARDQPGIPREELLGYLLEAAEALDWMNFGHDLQHLDVKPHNLFLVSNHIKVADFGLVDRPSDVARTNPTQRQGGVTPLYAAPEALNGNVSRQCDQYSLAIVYQQLLTGTVPFWCQNLYQLMVLHLTAEPNLTPLPKEDRAAVARALSKHPEKRFPSCLDFLQALICGESEGKPKLPRHAAVVKRLLTSLHNAEKTAEPVQPTGLLAEPSTDPKHPKRGSCPTVPSTPSDGPRKSAATVQEIPHGEPAACIPTPPRKTPSYALTCLTLPGYRFLHCLAHTALGVVWKVEDEQGRSRQALCVDNFVEQDPALIERLRNLKHPALPSTEVIWSPSGRLVLITEEFEHSLRDRLEVCQKQGLPGIPREELLEYLHTVADALDTLYRDYELSHLGLNPRALMLQGDLVRIADFGLVPLLWLPTGQTGGSLNGRYAAPEMFDRPDLSGVPPGAATRAALLGRAGSTSDQYSLALIYAELLNGIPPQTSRTGSGLHRRPTAPRRGRHGDSGMIGIRGQPRVDLDLLPSCDTAILRKALHDNPEKRFATCMELVEALERAAPATAKVANLYYRLPAVIPFASLQGEPPPRDLVLPSLNQLVLDLAAPSLGTITPPRQIVKSHSIRYVLQENDLWECKCPVQIFSGALALKVQGFREEWQARIARESNGSFEFHIEIPPALRSVSKSKAPPPRIAFELDVQASPHSIKYFAEATMRVHPTAESREGIAQVLPELAPRLFDSMRRYLHAGPEQRSEDRWTCPQPLHVYPVLRDLELDDILDGISRNISMGGVSFRLAVAPRTEQVYLHWHKSAAVASYAVLARIKHVQAMPGGGYEVGASFTAPA